MELKERFKQAFPDRFFLEADLQPLEAYLKKRDWIPEEESINLVEKPGEGNMNFVLRVATPMRSIIIKQARPWVEKYPQFDAPAERVEVEALYFTLVNKLEGLDRLSPQILDFDKENGILAMEDLGESADYTFLYQKGEMLGEKDLEGLVEYISVLHAWDTNNQEYPMNTGMRGLNYEHIFNYPYLVDNGLDLDTIQAGLQALSMPYRTDDSLKASIHELGALYVSKGPCLLHGDYYPGSWLRTAKGLRIIDPEFSFYGPPEFELGVLIAHMLMGQQSQSTIEMILDSYRQPTSFDSNLLAGFIGVEILRRLIGVAQLPLSLDLGEKDTLLQKGRTLLQKKELSFIL